MVVNTMATCREQINLLVETKLDDPYKFQMMMYGNDNYSTSKPTCSRWSHARRSLHMGKNNDGLLYQCHLLVLVGVTLGDPTKMQLSNYDQEYAFYVHYANKFFLCLLLLSTLPVRYTRKCIYHA